MVSASNALTSAGASIRAHVAGTNLIGQTIKTVTSSSGQAPQQQAIFSAIQAHQAQQRQNASPVRIQTSSGGSLLALAVHQSTAAASNIVTNQQQQQQNVILEQSSSSSGGNSSSTSGGAAVAPSGHQQQVRPVIKKRLQSFRLSKNPQ